MSCIPLPKDLKLANLKEIAAMVSHILINEGFVDWAGVIIGESKSDAYLPKFDIKDEAFIKYFRNTLIDFDLLYEFCKMASAKNTQCELDDSGNIIKLIYNNDIEYMDLIIHRVHIETDGPVTFDKYDNEHIFKATAVRDLDLNDFIYAMTNDYVYRWNKYIITKEAVPKPKKLKAGQFTISDIVSPYIYYTTVLNYDLMDIKIASVCFDLEAK